MFRRGHVVKTVLALASGGLLVVGPGFSASAHGGDHSGRHYEYYAASVLTTTDLKVGARSACATVWSDAGRPRGSVTFTTEGKAATATAPLGHGTGCVKLPRLRPGTYQLTARYNGYGRYMPSSGTAYLTVRNSGSGGHHARSVAYRPPVSPTAGDLGEWLRQFCWPA